MSRDDEWAAWARDFQDSSDTAPAPEEMLSAARRATRRQRLGYVIELLASVGLVAFYVVMLQRQRATWFVAMASANFVFVARWKGRIRPSTIATSATGDNNEAASAAGWRWERSFRERCIVVFVLAEGGRWRDV